MARRDVETWLLGMSLAILFGLGLWFRVTSLRTAPEPCADEAYYGVQALRLVRGESVATRTASGNLLNPFLLALDVPMVTAFEPSYTALRVPAALAGIVTIVLTYWLGRRALDPTTALIAAVLIAVLPVAIIFSRIGWEPSQIPLCGVLGLYFAFRAQRVGVVLVFLAGLLVHPSTLMLAPVLTSILLVKLIEQTWHDPARRWRVPLATMVVAALLVGPIAWENQGRAAAKWTYATYHFGPVDWGRFLTYYKKMLLGFCMGAPTETTRVHDWLFWGIVVAVLVAGTWRLARARCWDRLALVGGTIVTGAGLHLVTGPDVLQPSLVRYGLFLVAPTVWGFACLLRSLLAEPGGRWSHTVRRAQVVGLVGLAGALLVGTKGNWFDFFVAQSGGRENLWTLRTESAEPLRRMATLLTRDLPRPDDATRPDGRLIITEDWWSYRPLQFFLSRREGVRVACLERVRPQDQARILREHLGAGAYAVGVVNQGVDQAVRAAFPRDRLRHWHVQVGLHPCYAVYRLKQPGEVATGRCFCEVPTTAGGERPLAR